MTKNLPEEITSLDSYEIREWTNAKTRSVKASGSFLSKPKFTLILYIIFLDKGKFPD